MKKHTADLKIFQKEVLREYESLTKRINIATTVAEQKKVFVEKPGAGITRKIIYQFLNPAVNYVYQDYLETDRFKSLEKKALVIIEDQEVKDYLCVNFKRRSVDKLFKEEMEIEVIIILTNMLNEKRLAAKFSTDESKQLFSMMAYKILQQGVKDYC